ncbi:lipase family alpha/beta hydrolase [Nocardioides jejuensis]|uniref:Alpha/beta hydrolase n=1 Tax=Nocardioides jejuensis TaxID=2502782 RepID=A0A4R1CGL1_9ACTN|nr:alpha/beta fold hydrolase [Nocardioides jejuensis]TCJ30071.1 alpha/beta hydrolase [Nocardioides jejuensis]
MSALEPAPVSARVVAAPAAGGATLHGTGALAATYAEDLLLGTVRDTHLAISGRVWGIVNPLTLGAGKPSQLVHDAIANGIYRSLGQGLRGGARVLEVQDRKGRGRRTEELRFGRHVTSVVNGLIGDRLTEDGSSSAIRMAVRDGGHDVPLTPEGLRAAFPQATGQVVVFVHGLMEHDEHWDRRADELPSYGAALAATGDWSPVRLRVNSGLSIAENGVALAALLDELVAGWPVPVTRIALVGHSMGGLIIRRACVVDTGARDPWRELVTDVVTLGTPHLGAPLERLVHHGAWALGKLPEVRSIARILDTRSVGISDLRRGVRDEVARLPRARYHLVSATLGPTVFHPLSVAFGDLLVRHPSAMGRSGRVDLFPGASTLHLPNTDHFGLLNHPEVHRKLKEWLA